MAREEEERHAGQHGHAIRFQVRADATTTHDRIGQEARIDRAGEHELRLPRRRVRVHLVPQHHRNVVMTSGA